MTTATLRHLCAQSYGNGFTMWHYRANSLAEVTQADFFIDAQGIMQQGDMVLVSAPDGGAQFFVTKPVGGVPSLHLMLCAEMLERSLAA